MAGASVRDGIAVVGSAGYVDKLNYHQLAIHGHNVKHSKDFRDGVIEAMAERNYSLKSFDGDRMIFEK